MLSDRALNRATLERQLLLRRSPLAPLDAVRQLVGLQAQLPLDPYLALWSRLEDFDPAALGALIEDRSLVRIVVMRGTIHLVTGEDALALRPLMQPVLDAEIARHQDFAPHLVGVDMAPVLAFAQERLAERPLSGPRLRAVLAEEFPTLDAPALSYACRCFLPLVQVPPRGVWGKSLQVTMTTLDAWLGRSLRKPATIDDVVMRYIGVFGPATAADVMAWSRLAGLREVVERLRPRLRVFRDAKGRELFDVPDGPRPDPDTPAPVRFLPEYDNVLLSHADRTRFGTDEERRFAGAQGPFKGSVLVDGAARAIWHPERDAKARRATLVVEHRRLDRSTRAAVKAEAQRVATFLHPNAERVDVRLALVS